MVFFRGVGGAARAYLESDHSHADEYYLESGGTVAQWSALSSSGEVTASRDLTGDQYADWVNWKDPETGEVRGHPRTISRVTDEGEVVERPSSPRFAEMTVNCDKSLSVAAALSPEVSAALDDAQASAVEALNGYMAEHSVTRVGPLGSQRYVPVEQLESVAVVHRSSRAGDPHRHVHVQWNTRVFAAGKWRGLYTGATLQQQAAMRGIGEAAITGNERLRTALAENGFTFDPSTGKVAELAEHADLMSKRAAQISDNRERLERQWQAEHPGMEPSPALVREWDSQAWSLERPQKQHSPAAAESRWITELRDAGLPVDEFIEVSGPAQVPFAETDVETVIEEATATLESKQSAWSLADVEGAVGEAFARQGACGSPAEARSSIRETAEAILEDAPTLPVRVEGTLPEWVKFHTSERVQAVEQSLRDRLTARGLDSGLALSDERVGTLNEAQSLGARALSTEAPLIVVEGAAGSGKTTMLGEARKLAEADDRRLVIVAPTLRAAQEASASSGIAASSAHKLAHEHGYRWDEFNRWHRLSPGETDADGFTYTGPSERARLDSSTRLVIDEAGMCDQDLTHALLTIADEAEAPVALIGDRAQLPAVGRGGVLDFAVAASPAPVDLTEVHRFRDPAYAPLMDDMRARRDPGALFDQLSATEHLHVWKTHEDLLERLSETSTADAIAGRSVAVAVRSNEEADVLNRRIQRARADAFLTRPGTHEVAGSDGLTLRRGDALMTRDNDSRLGVANRDVWEVKRTHSDQSVTVTDGHRDVRLPADYVREHTHLAYASTVYGVQGATVDAGHAVIDDSSNAQSAYVAATRGRESNDLHIIAESREDARELFENVMEHEGGDRGLAEAQARAESEVAGMDLSPTPEVDEKIRAERRAFEQARYEKQLRAYEQAEAKFAADFPGMTRAEGVDAHANAVAEAKQATADLDRAREEGARRIVDEQTRRWQDDVARVEAARQAQEQAPFLRQKRAREEAVTAEREFQQRWGASPTSEPPATLRDAWARSGSTPESSPTVAAAAERERAAKANVDRYQGHSLTGASAPTPPKTESPVREWEKDQAWAKRRSSQTEQTAQKKQAQAKTRTQTNAPEISR